MGRSRLPEGTKRIRVFGRVDPATVEFLDSLGEKNSGRAIDTAAKLARGLREALGAVSAATAERFVKTPPAI